MFNNISGKLKVWAIITVIMGNISAIISGVSLISQGEGFGIIGIVIMFAGILSSWLTAWILFGLGDLIEEGNILKVEEYLFDKLSCYKGVKNVVLGCTHYPLVKDSIKKVLGDVLFFDGSIGVSRELIRQLNNRNINYKNSSLNIRFVDSSNDYLKEERFRKIIKESFDS